MYSVETLFCLGPVTLRCVSMATVVRTVYSLHVQGLLSNVFEWLLKIVNSMVFVVLITNTAYNDEAIKTGN